MPIKRRHGRPRRWARTPGRKDWGFRWDDDGPSLYVGRHTNVSLRARFQGHLRESEAPLGDGAGFDLARRRIGIEGRVGGVVDFEVDHEIGHDDPWRDLIRESFSDRTYAPLPEQPSFWSTVLRLQFSI